MPLQAVGHLNSSLFDSLQSTSEATDQWLDLFEIYGNTKDSIARDSSCPGNTQIRHCLSILILQEKGSH